MTSDTSPTLRSPALRSMGAAVALAAAALASAPAAAQQSYPLTCRGGGKMGAIIRTPSVMDVVFLAGQGAAGSGAPRAGECRWLDRAFASGEPNKLAISGADAGNMMYVLDALVRGGTFQVHVYNDGNGAMRVTRFGP